MAIVNDWILHALIDKGWACYNQSSFRLAFWRPAIDHIRCMFGKNSGMSMLDGQTVLTKHHNRLSQTHLVSDNATERFFDSMFSLPHERNTQELSSCH